MATPTTPTETAQAMVDGPPDETQPGPPAADLDDMNTGVPSDTDLTPSGSIEVTDNGATVEGLDIRGTITVRADDVVIRNSRVVSPDGSYGIAVGYDQQRVVIEDTEIDGAGNSQGIGVCCSGYTLKSSNIHGFRVGAKMAENVVIEASYFHDNASAEGTHGTAISTNGGQHFVVRNNKLDVANTPGASAALSLYGDFAPVHDVLVEGNLLTGGSYCTYGGSLEKKPYGASDVRYVGNRFSRAAHPLCGVHGPVVAFDIAAPGNEWSGNVWHETGEPVDVTGS